MKIAATIPAVLLLALAASTLAQDALPEKPTFNRDIRPVLSDNCFRCHGFDPGTREAGLRLDVPEGAFEDRDGTQAIVPGHPEQSAVIARITSEDESERMPPVDSHQKLSAQQIELIRRWIQAGAEYEPHWAFIAPQEPAVPEVPAAAGQIHNPIDAFVFDRLAREGLKPSPEADRATLLRRVTLDLTGLPPTPEELDAFLADTRPDAYERAVDRLLASPRYGERMAIEWLDAARYADTNGYQGDQTRTMWPWRDWVIAAMNANMPFDHFTVEQLAGDLLPDATVDQRLATGFNRNHPLNGEGGRIPEESRNDYVMDRVETLGTVWLGLTIGCCRCHDHKFDPIAQREYYQIFAYFNNIAESGSVDAGNGSGNAKPVMRLIRESDQQRIDKLKQAVAAAEEALNTALPRIDEAQRQWQQSAKDPADELPEFASLPDESLNDEQREKLRNYYRTQVSEEYPPLAARLDAARKELANFQNSLPECMVMEELPEPRETRILDKGIYTQPLERVTPGTLSVLHKLPEDAPPNRLGLARWLVDPANPLTARVTVNRYWQQFFSTGLVKTAGDFGVQGEAPSHRELLDWLAVRFVKSGWDVKALHRLLVTSATYRQASQVSPELLERDPDNRLLARGPRHRLSAYTIRDQALAVSGLLVEQVGGPPVRPYMAAGVWEDASLGQIRYQQDTGDKLYRRSLYTFWRRIAAPANLFDISSRSLCTVQLPRTNTPLQALILMNDVQYVEAARQLATRTLTEGGDTPEQRLTLAMRLCTSRAPRPEEMSVLLGALEKLLSQYGADPAAADQLTSQGASSRPENIDLAELAAYTGVASLILNLDETISKE